MRNFSESYSIYFNITCFISNLPVQFFLISYSYYIAEKELV